MSTPVGIDPDGIWLPDDGEHVLDLLVDGRRVWSFRPSENAVEDPRGWFVAWPRDLHRYLVGSARLAVRASAGETLAETDLVFGAPEDAGRRVLVEDRDGHALVVDTGGRLVRTFESRGADALAPLIDALEVVVDALGRCGVDAFPAYGSLLGAVREGHVIGHDNDADVGYVSRHTHPADVILESFRLQRMLHHMGFEITRYSGAGFKVEVDSGSGLHIGLDVFTGFFYQGHLVLMGEIFEPFERSWMLPLGEVELEGRSFPAPAEPERLLAAMYGPSWRVPDPTFRFTTSESTRHRLDQWFRGTRTYRNLWDRRYSTSAAHGPWHRDPHKLAKLLHRREEPGTAIADLGCGRGQDAVWLANRGHRVTGLDFSGNGYHHLSHRAEVEGWSAQFHAMNLLESRHVIAWGARLALEPGPHALLARHVLDATTERGRQGLWRIARMVLGDGGRLYLEFMASIEGRPDIEYDDGLVHDLDPDLVAAEAEAAGGTVTTSVLLEARAYERPSQPVAGSPEPRKCRMVVEWAP